MPSIRVFKCEVSHFKFQISHSKKKISHLKQNSKCEWFALGILFEVRIFALGIFWSANIRTWIFFEVRIFALGILCRVCEVYLARTMQTYIRTSKKFQVRIFALQKNSKCEYSHFKQNSKCESDRNIRTSNSKIRTWKRNIRTWKILSSNIRTWNFALEPPYARHWWAAFQDTLRRPFEGICDSALIALDFVRQSI